MISPSNLVPLRNAIKARLISEMAVGGRINGVVSVGDVWLNDTTVYPYISVWVHGRSEKVEAVGRKRSTIRFVIGLAIESDISLEDAYDRLYTTMDDGAGHGLEAILRDPSVYSWGGLATQSEITEVQYADSVQGDKSASLTQFVAYGIIQYTVTQMLDASTRPT